MKMSCVICGNKAGAFAKKTSEGVICKSCLSFIPTNVILSQASTEFLKRIYDENVEKSKQFETTASYQGLYIDSVHGLCCYSKRGDKQAPSEFKDIYRISELTEVALYCTDVKNVGTNHNHIVCDIKFKVRTKDIAADFIIAHHKKCDFKVKNKQIEWDEPSELTMFRNMFNQMIDNELFGLLKKLEKIQEFKQMLSKEERSSDWARGVLFLDNEKEYTEEDLKKHRNELVKIFHPDRNSEYANTETAALINKAYKILCND